ncbi:MAG: hypothetical protein U0736_19035 [Gemmataceae bacterium]
MLEVFQHDHAGAFAEDEPVAVEVERLRRLRGVVARRQGGEQVEAGNAERVNHAVRPAGEHDLGLALANHVDRLANRLAGGRTRRQAVGVRPFQAEVSGQVGGGGVQLLLGLAFRVEGSHRARMNAG